MGLLGKKRFFSRWLNKCFSLALHDLWFITICILRVKVALREPLLYGDYRTALQPEQPRVYEDIQDYEAAKGLFDEVSSPSVAYIYLWVFFFTGVGTGGFIS